MRKLISYAVKIGPMYLNGYTYDRDEYDAEAPTWTERFTRRTPIESHSLANHLADKWGGRVVRITKRIRLAPKRKSR